MKETSRHKQIREMSQIIRDANSVTYPENYFIGDARLLYRAGYRKASEVAEEIFAAVDESISMICDLTGFSISMFGKYHEIKKKYTEGGNDKSE